MAQSWTGAKTFCLLLGVFLVSIPGLKEINMEYFRAFLGQRPLVINLPYLPEYFVRTLPLDDEFVGSQG